MIAQVWRVSSRRAVQAQAIRPRFFSSSIISRNVTQEAGSISQPLTETVRNVAQTAQRVVVDNSSAEGFKAGVVYTLLAGTVATAAVTIFSPTGDRTVESKDLI